MVIAQSSTHLAQSVTTDLYRKAKLINAKKYLHKVNTNNRYSKKQNTTVDGKYEILCFTTTDHDASLHYFNMCTLATVDRIPENY